MNSWKTGRTTLAAGGSTVEKLASPPADWDAFVSRTGGNTFCHLAGWAEIMAEALAHEWLGLVVRDDDGAYRGVLPLVRVRTRIFGDRLVSMPFLNYGGPLGDDDARRLLLEAAVAEARRCGCDQLDIRARERPGGPVPGALRAGREKVTVLLDLPADPEELWRDRFPSKLRSQIRRARREEMDVRFGAGEIAPFYDVFARTMRDLGTPVLPRRFFDLMAGAFPDLVEVATVWWRGEPVAAGYGFARRGEFEITWAGSLREHNRKAPNMLLYWSLMERMCRRGIRVFNFGRCTPGGGTHRFKRQWGGVDVPLPWLEWSARPDAKAAPADRPAYRAAASAWRRLPLGVSRRIGPLLARALP